MSAASLNIVQDGQTRDASVPFVSQHLSWISLDPIQGCPASCSYCYLWPLGLTKSRPVVYISPEELYNRLDAFPLFAKSGGGLSPLPWHPPVAVGNHTDMCLTPANRDYLLRMLKVHKARFPDLPLCILTKAEISESFADAVAASGVSVIFFISLAFLGVDVEKGAPAWQRRLANFRTLRARHIPAVHWWRPLTKLSTGNATIAQDQLNMVYDAGSICSVNVELAFNDTLLTTFSSVSHTMSGALQSAQQSHVSQAAADLRAHLHDMIAEVATLARQLHYPIFRSTSCAVSWALRRPCYAARYRALHRDKSCFACSTAETQHGLCESFRTANVRPTPEIMQYIAIRLNLQEHQLRFDPVSEAIHVDCSIRQDEQAALTQVTTFPIVARSVTATLAWNGDSPQRSNLKR